MKTFQDFQKVGDNEKDRMLFVHSAILSHRGDEIFRVARDAELYDAQQNVTIMKFRKLLYSVSGEVVPDNFSANYKLCSNFFDRLTTQRNSHLLGNGVNFGKPDTKEKLGRYFDQMMVELGHQAQIGGVSFGFWNFDHLEVFGVTQFVPLYDEENGALMAGIRFWQVASDKPLRATLYEVDGLTDYLWDKENPNGSVLVEKRAYKTKATGAPVDPTKVYDGENYEKFPIIPLFNVKRQSDLIGMREYIDAYDLILSGFCSTIDETSLIYWVITNAGGLDEIDEVEFRNKIKRTGVALVEQNGAQVESHTVDIPFAAREASLTRLRNDIYENYMNLDTHDISAGATTATQIEASYEPLNAKTDAYETRVTTFILNLLDFLGIDDEPTYKRSKIVNKAEEIQLILQSAEYLPEKYVTKSILTILGDVDAYEEVEQMKMEEELERQNLTKEDEESWQSEDEETEDTNSPMENSEE